MPVDHQFTRESCWGFTYTADVKGCRDALGCFMDDFESKFQAQCYLNKFCAYVVEAIGMQAYGSPQMIMFGEGNAAGWTVIQLLTTSALVMHLCNESRDIYIDLTSCKYFAPDTIEHAVNRWFSPESVKYTYHRRDTRLN